MSDLRRKSATSDPGEVAVSDWGSLPDSSDDKEKTYKSFQGIFHLISHSGTMASGELGELIMKFISG